MSYEKFERFQAELSRASQRDYISGVWRLLHFFFSEYWEGYNRIEKQLSEKEPEEVEKIILNTEPIRSSFSNVCIFSTMLFMAIRRFSRIKNVGEFEEEVFSLPSYLDNKNEVKKIVMRLNSEVSKLIPLSESAEAFSLPE